MSATASDAIMRPAMRDLALGLTTIFDAGEWSFSQGWLHAKSAWWEDERVHGFAPVPARLANDPTYSQRFYRSYNESPAFHGLIVILVVVKTF